MDSGELEKLKQWIAQGAPADNETPVVVDVARDPLVKASDRKLLAFAPPTRPAVPAGTHMAIDAFISDRLAAKNLTFAKQAGKLTLMRRAYFDLIGLPPSPEEVQAYLADKSPDAYDRLIDRLLSSPRYGERWARSGSMRLDMPIAKAAFPPMRYARLPGAIAITSSAPSTPTNLITNFSRSNSPAMRCSIGKQPSLIHSAKPRSWQPQASSVSPRIPHTVQSKFSTGTLRRRRRRDRSARLVRHGLVAWLRALP